MQSSSYSDQRSYNDRKEHSRYEGKSRDRDERYNRDNNRSRDAKNDRFEREPYRDRDRAKNRNNDRDKERDRDRDVERLRERSREKDNSKQKEVRGNYKVDFSNRPTLFDIPPPGYETTSPLEFKKLKASGSLPVMAIPQGSTIVFRARLLQVDAIPENLDETDFLNFINKECHERQIAIKPKDLALSLEFSEDKKFVIVEFRTAEETSNALSLDGLVYKDCQLRFARPADFQQNMAFYYGYPHVFQDTLNKLFVACIPVYLTDEQVKDLLSAFGELKAFNLVKDGASGLSKGYAFCEYRDASVTDIAIAGLNGMQIADKKLVVQRAVLGSRQGTNLGGIIPSQMQVPGIDSEQLIVADITNSEVLTLANMITEDDLKNTEEFDEIVEDIKSECAKYGEVVSIEIPRSGSECLPESVGKVFVEYANKEMCREAYEALAGRKFGGNLVITAFYDTEKYKKKEF